VKVERSFRNSTASIRAARRFVAEALAPAHAAEADAVVLMVSELATNSIRHAESDFTVALTTTRRQVRVEVTDHGTGAPAARRPSPSELSGRGLLIVDKLAHRWGVRRQPSGSKTVWFTVPAHSPAGDGGAGSVDVRRSASLNQPSLRYRLT
jgi:anti-sigma regulatory factor (Ser/Thr protein kinase)